MMKQLHAQEAGTGHTVRRGRGKSRASIAIIEASIRILAEIQPASVRAVCYRLFTEGLIESMAKGKTNKVSRLLVDAREDGLVPWDWIVDETREAERICRLGPPRGHHRRRRASVPQGLLVNAAAPRRGLE